MAHSAKPWQRFALTALLIILALGGFALTGLSGQKGAPAGTAFANDGITPVAAQAAVPVALAPDTAVAMFSPRHGHWPSALLHDVQPGGEFIYQDHLHRVTDSGAVERVPDVDVRKLPDADRAFDKASHRFPEAADVVMVLDKDMTFTHHAVLGTLQPGIRVCFQGRAYDLRAGRTASTMAIADTGIVSARVTQTFQHTGDKAADTIIDVTIRTADGQHTVLHATPNHPFFVPDRKEYVELGHLTPGTKLQTADQGEATIVAMNTRKGTFDVYNLEVEGPHNYYVGDQKVLVHNKAAVMNSIRARIRTAGLPGGGSKSGPLRYRPPEGYQPGNPLPKGPNGGYLDRFGNEWVKCLG